MKTKHRILSVLTILALVASLSAVMVTPAFAAATLTLTPNRGLPGTEVSVIGTGFPKNTPGTLTAAGVIDPVSFMTGPGGEIAVIVTILPGAPVGPQTLTATVGGVTASATFTVEALPAAITLSPASGVPGTEVTVTGVRFPPNAPGVLSAPGVISPVTFMTDADGAIPATTVTILPDAHPGEQTLTATVGEISDTATFTVIAVPVPTIDLAPTSGMRGWTVRVTGTGFPANAPGVITAPGVIDPVTFMTTADGAIPQATTVTIRGDAPFGLATITATVGVVSDDALFTVTPPPAPTITLSPTAGARGTVVTVTGANFAPGTKGVIMAPGVIAPIGFTTQGVGDPNPGSFSTTVAILGDAPFGAATFTVTVGVVSATETFTVQAPSITLTPIGGVRGAQVTVTGEGFPPGTAGTITAPGVIDPVGFTTTPAGKIPATIATILLDAPLGPATFTATVDPPGPPPAVTAEATYTVGITPTIELRPTIGFEGTKVTVRGFGFPVETAGTITAPGVITPKGFRTTAAGTIPEETVTILVGAPVGSATITATVGDLSATAQFVVAGPGVPVIVPEPVVPVLEGLEGIWDRLGEAIWHFKDGRWFRFHTDPAIHALIDEDERLTELVSGEAYWIYLTEDVTDELIGGVRRTLRAGWHNIGWVL